MKRALVGVALTSALLFPATSASAAPMPTAIGSSGSSSSGSAGIGCNLNCPAWVEPLLAVFNLIAMATGSTGGGGKP